MSAAAANGNSIHQLAARLTRPEDRERYASIVSYFASLDENDDLFKFAEMLGLLTLLGQRVPDVLAESLAELRELGEKAGKHYGQINDHLARLPAAVSSGVDLAAVAKALSEAFRQQIVSTGLQDATECLKSTTAQIGELTAALKPAAQQYVTVSAGITSELAKLTAAQQQLQEQNARLAASERASNGAWQALLALLLFVVGVFSGLIVEKRQTQSALANLEMQIQRLQATAFTEPAPKKGKR